MPEFGLERACGGWEFPLSRTETMHRSILCYELDVRLSQQIEFVLVRENDQLRSQVQNLEIRVSELQSQIDVGKLPVPLAQAELATPEHSTKDGAEFAPSVQNLSGMQTEEEVNMAYLDEGGMWVPPEVLGKLSSGDKPLAKQEDHGGKLASKDEKQGCQQLPKHPQLEINKACEKEGKGCGSSQQQSRSKPSSQQQEKVGKWSPKHEQKESQQAAKHEEKGGKAAHKRNEKAQKWALKQDAHGGGNPSKQKESQEAAKPEEKGGKAAHKQNEKSQKWVLKQDTKGGGQPSKHDGGKWAPKPAGKGALPAAAQEEKASGKARKTEGKKQRGWGAGRIDECTQDQRVESSQGCSNHNPQERRAEFAKGVQVLFNAAEKSSVQQECGDWGPGGWGASSSGWSSGKYGRHGIRASRNVGGGGGGKKNGKR